MTMFKGRKRIFAEDPSAPVYSSAEVKQKQQMCKPASGNSGHKMSRYSWFTVYKRNHEVADAS